MTLRSRRVLAAGAGVIVMLALVALAASRGGPVSSDAGGRSVSGAFLDVVFTLGGLGIVLTIVVLLFSMRIRREGEEDFALRSLLLTAAALVAFFALIALGAYLLAGDEPRRAGPLPRLVATGPAGATGAGGAAAPQPELHDGDAHVSWPTVAIVIGSVILLAGATYGRLEWSRRRALRRDKRAVEAVRAVLQEAIDDLERRDPREAVIAAYARMERTLAVHGLPRLPAEAPFEYVRRALTGLHATAASARELTELFELAKFSEHDIDETDRAAALRALVAVRDELALEVAA